MIESAPRVAGRLQELIDTMPSMAKAANAFASEENQQTALSAMLLAFGFPENLPAPAQSSEPGLSVVTPISESRIDGSTESSPDTVTAAVSRRSRPRKKAAIRPIDIDFRPEGKPTLREFAAEKMPTDNNEKNAVVVYYLTEILGVGTVEVGHVLAAYIESEWKIPADPADAIVKTAHRRRWLDSSSLKDIKLTFSGRNLVRLELPKTTAKSA
jgi:hypothetical protein